jgi:hypothetical protein
MGKPTKYTKELLQELVKESTSVSEVVRKIGQRTDRGFVTYISKLIKRFDIDKSHFMTRFEAVRYTKNAQKRPLSDFFENKYPIKTHNLRLRLFKEGIKDEKCEGCGITHWRGRRLTFELHHVDKNPDNNALSNLLVLCPNCHYYEHKEK